MSSLTLAILTAAEEHDGQTDRSGEPYILHSLRVMLATPSELGEEGRIIAVLHDVPEDSEHGWQAVHDCRFSSVVTEALDALTRRKSEGETYEEYIDRVVAAGPLAMRIKLADLDDNTSPSRASTDLVSESLMRRYRKARARILLALADS